EIPVSLVIRPGIDRRGSIKDEKRSMTWSPRIFTAPISITRSSYGERPVVSVSVTTNVASDTSMCIIYAHTGMQSNLCGSRQGDIRREAQGDRSALTPAAFGVDRSVEPLGQLTNQRQTQPNAPVSSTAATRSLVKGRKQFRRVVCVES